MLALTAGGLDSPLLPNGAQAMSIAANGNSDDLLTERQAAELLTVSSRTLQSWRSDGLGPPFVRVGRSVRYPRKELLDWLADNTVRARQRK